MVIRKRALIYFTTFFSNVGGSEYLVFALIHDLQQRGFNVTLALQNNVFDPLLAVDDYGVGIDKENLTVVNLAPVGGFVKWVDRHLHAVWMWRLRRMGPKYDICFSCANPVDFGRPGVHFINMMTIDAGFQAKIWGLDKNWKKHVRNCLVGWRDYWVCKLMGARTPRQIIRDAREVVLPNSNYVKELIERYYGCKVHEAFYPPTIDACVSQMPIGRNKYDIACIGRINPEKRILEIIDIVERARLSTGLPLRLRIAGRLSATPYVRLVRAAAASREWIVLEGMLTGVEKARYLAECNVAVHACEVEAFGISIAEYLKAGIVPVVPRKGGSREVVDNDSLVYDNVCEAANLVSGLVLNAAFCDEMRKACLKRAIEFSAAAYWHRQSRLLDELCQKG